MRNTIGILTLHGFHCEPEEFLTPILENLVFDCLQENEIEAFPSCLYANSYEAFVQENELVLVPILIWHHDSNPFIIESLTRLLKKSEKSLMEDNYVSLASIFLSDLETAKAQKLFETVRNILGEEKHNKLLNRMFPQVFGHGKIGDCNHISD